MAEQDSPTIEDVLAHYGIKGQRWGVRRSNPSGAKASKPKSEDAQKAKSIQAKAKKSGLDSLSNDELKVLVNRMQLESNYKTVKAKNLSGGKSFAKQTVKEVGKKTTNELLGKAVSAGIGAATAAFLAKKAAKRAAGG
jgi:hypothetical protein